MKRFKKTGRKLNLSFLFKREFKRKIVPLAVMASLVAFSFAPMATSAPVQDDAAGSWEDSFSDDTGIDLTKSSAIDVSGGSVTFNDAGWTRDDPWGIEIVDSGVGNNNSDPSSLKIEVDFNGIPHIVYLDRTNGVFKYACWNGGGWDKQTIPGSLAQVDGVIDMAIDGNNNVHIVYSRSQNNSLYYTVWDGSNWSDRIEITGNIDRPTFSVSITTDSNNVPHVVWPNHNTDPGRIFYTKGPTWVLESFDSNTFTYNCSISVDSSNNPHIVYADLYGVSTGSNKVDIKHAVKTAGSWDFKIIREAANSKGFVTPVSAEIDTNNRLWVIYPKWGFWGINTIYQYLSIDGGSSWDGRIVTQSAGLWSHHNSVDFSNSELGISYKDGSVVGGLKFSVRSLSDDVSDSWSHMLIDPVSNSTYEEAIASGNDGFFHIAYYDLADSGCIKYAGSPLRGTVISKEITPTMIDGWDTFSAVDNTASGSITYSILDGNDLSIIKSNVINGQDISDIDATIHPTIRLKASISATGNPAVSAILHDWKITWLPDTTPPALTTEAWIPDDGGTYITDGGTVNLDDIDEAGEKITIKSDASDDSGIFSQQINWYHYNSGGTLIGGGSGSEVMGDGSYSLTINGPLNDGDKIEYTSQATDTAVPPNTAYDPASGRYSFTVVETKTWAKAFGGTVNDYAHSIQQTSDGGYVTAGYTYSYGSGSSDSIITKIDSSGTQEWAKTFGEAGIDITLSVKQTSDGGYIVAGFSDSYTGSQDFLIIRLDSSGNQKWARAFGGAGSDILSWDFAGNSFVQQTFDGGYIITGYTQNIGAVGSDRILVIKVNPDVAGNFGGVDWTKTFGNNILNVPQSIQQTSDGGYIIVGWNKDPVANDEILLLKIDSSGNQKWAKILNEGGFSRGSSIQQTSDGGYILTSWGGYVIKVNPDVAGNFGGVDWGKKFEGATCGAVGAIRYAQQTSDGEYIIAGQINSIAGTDLDTLILRLDSSGVQRWARAFGGSNNEIARSVQQTSDGGYVAVGQTSSYGAGGTDSLVLKLDQNGNIEDCSPPLRDPGMITVSGVTPIVTDITPTVTDVIATLIVTDVTPTTTSPTLTETNVCVPPDPPTCSISTPLSAEVGITFDIDVSGSIDPDGDINNAQVRFLSDDNQDDNPSGTWTGWFDWDVSNGDWDAATKKMSWSFAAVGSKEVWVEIEDEDGLTCQNHSDMDALAGNAAPTALFDAVAN